MVSSSKTKILSAVSERDTANEVSLHSSPSYVTTDATLNSSDSFQSVLWASYSIGNKEKEGNNSTSSSSGPM